MDCSQELRPRKELLGREYGDSAKRMEREKVRIAGYDVLGNSSHCEFEELVVAGISTLSNPGICIYPFRFTHQGGEKLPNILLGHIPAKLFSAQDLMDFGKHSIRKQHRPFEKRAVKRFPGFGVRQQQCAHQDIGIKNAAQLCALQEGIEDFRG